MRKPSTSTQPPTKPVNHACRDVGHDWQLTTNDTFRKCSRHDCQAVERLIYGSWVPVSSSPAPSEQQESLTAPFYQQPFWTAGQHTERPLHLESLSLFTKEQREHFARTQRAYYNLISGPRSRKAR